MAEAMRQAGGRFRPAILVAALAVLTLALPAGAPAGASGSVSMSARINGTPAATSTQQNPVNLSPDHPATVSLRVTNSTGSPVTIRTVRIEGSVIGLTFFSYDTSVALRVRAGATLRFALDTSGLGGQAIGLIPGSVELLNGQRTVVASQSMVTNVHGSLISVYGLFGLALADPHHPGLRRRPAGHGPPPDVAQPLAPRAALPHAGHRARARPGLHPVRPGRVGPEPGHLARDRGDLRRGVLRPRLPLAHARALEEEDDEDLDESEFLVPAASTSAESDADSVSLDQQAVIDALPAYEIGGELGRGGWGVVLAGKHRQLGRDVAIKQLPRAFAVDESIRSRFTVEARLLASLDHPHIVPVYDFVEQDGLCLLVMELLPGGTVWSRFTGDGFTASGACAVVLACLSGLQAAHGRQVLHRDIKPENLMFSSTGALKVTDFGIAKVVGGEETMATRAGEVVGTPAYIAPEQARGGDLSPATDVYAVATMLYELLSGQLPFADDGDAMALMFKHAFEQPEPLLEKAPTRARAGGGRGHVGAGHRPGGATAVGRGVRRRAGRGVHGGVGPGLAPDRRHAGHGCEQHRGGDRATVHPSRRRRRRRRARRWRPTRVRRPPRWPGPSGPRRRPRRWPGRRPHRCGRRSPSHARRAALADVTEGAADLVPLKEVLTPPPSPARYFIAAAVLVVVAFVVALVGVGAPSSGGTLSAGEVKVAGTDVISGGTVTVNLSKPVPVVVSASAPAADHVQLSSTVLGQQVSSATAPLVPAASGRTALVDLGGRYLVGGSFTGKVTLWQGLVAGR